MSITLIVVLVVLMIVNQVIGTSYGSWKEGFKKELLLSGLWKIASLALGYGALAFAAHYASQYVPSAEYLSGILVESIANIFLRYASHCVVSLTIQYQKTLRRKTKISKSFTYQLVTKWNQLVLFCLKV